MLLGVLGSFAVAQRYDQEKQNKDATCNVSQALNWY
jgi:hypothetical protein